MKILLVDDDKIVIETMISSFPWTNWGITEIRTAWSVKEAKSILEQERIDILFCDIEMPMATGIELIEWIKQELEYEPVRILLTCHSEFQYAQRAIQLGCSNYLLKPVDEETMKKAVLEAEERVLEMRRQERERLRREQKIQNMDGFWELLMASRIGEGKKLLEVCEEYAVLPQALCRPVLISVKHYAYRMREISMALLSFILENVIRELFEGEAFALVNQANGKIWMFFPESGWQKQLQERVALEKITLKKITLEKLTEKLQMVFAWMQEHYCCELSGYIGDEVSLTQWKSQCRELEQAQERLAACRKVYMPEEIRSRIYIPFECSAPAKSNFLKLFSEKKYEQLLRRMQEYFEGLTWKQYTVASISAAVKQLDMEFERLLETQEAAKFQKEQIALTGEMPNYTETIPGVLEYYERLFAQLRQENEEEASISLIEKVKLFVSMNISQEIGREEIASHAGMNPDYLNRLFKKETGMSLKEYIVNEKIKMACELLEQTDILVGEIGEMVGYVNFSSFSTFFKSRTGMTPGAWRKEHGICTE